VLARTTITSLGRIARDYLAEVQWAEIAKGHIELQSRPLQIRVLFWLGIALLVVNLIVTMVVYLASGSLNQVTFEWYAPQVVPQISIGFAGLWFVMGWAYLLAGAAASNVFFFLLTAFLSTSTLLLLAPGFQTPGNAGLWPMIPLLAVMLLTPWALGHPTAEGRGTRAQWLVAGALGVGAAFVILFLSPLRFQVPLPYRWLAMILLAFPICGLTMWLRRPAQRLSPITYWLMAQGILIPFGAASIWLGGADPAESASALTLSVMVMLGYVAMFWFWLGSEIVDQTDKLVRWLLKSAHRVLPATQAGSLVVGVWASLFLVGLVVPWLSAIASSIGIWPGPTEGDLRVAILNTLDLTPWIIAGFATLAVVLHLARALTAEIMLTLLRLSLLFLLLIVGVWGAAFDLVTEERGRLGLWALGVYLVGLVGEAIKGSAPYVNSGSRHFPRDGRLLLWLGFLLTMSATSHFALNADLSQVNRVIRLETLFGALCLSAPAILYLTIFEQRHARLPAPGLLLALFASGFVLVWGSSLVSAILVALIGGGSGSHQLPVQILVQVALGIALLTWGLRRLDRGLHWTSPLFLALALGLGIGTFQAHPQSFLPLVPVPWQLSPGTVGLGLTGMGALDLWQLARLYLEHFAVGCVGVMALVMAERAGIGGGIRVAVGAGALALAASYRVVYEFWLATAFPTVSIEAGWAPLVVPACVIIAVTGVLGLVNLATQGHEGQAMQGG
jgi:hypothetical protein